MDYKKVNVVDLEMLCWDGDEEPGLQEISEIGIVQVDMVKREITRQQHFYCRVEQIGMVSNFYTELTGTPRARLHKAPHTLVEVLNILGRKWGFGTKMWVSWGSDNVPLMPYSKLVSQSHFNLAAMINVITQPTRRLSLADGLDLFGLDFEGREHNAVDDAFNTAKAFLKYIEKYDVSDK